MRLPICLLFVFCGALVAAVGDEPDVAPLERAHAHNDYRHPRPLLDAVANGFCSVEADIFLVDGKLLVGHDRFELRKDRTLQSLYLDPLRELVQRNDGRVYPDGPTVTLLIDLKSDGRATYAVLRETFAGYRDILSGWEDGEYRQRAVQVVISGDRPIEDLVADQTRYAGIDGRLGDLESTFPSHLMPLISDRWTTHFRWRGVGEMPAEEREKLHSIVTKAHAAGRRVRFWATPENPDLWQELLDAEVDHINTDQLEKVKRFLTRQ